jgi:hypothetical protein
MRKKSQMESFASEYAMSAGDNALSREQINNSITSKATANEVEYVKALKQVARDRAAE